jgi:hypothetical protein
VACITAVYWLYMLQFLGSNLVQDNNMQLRYVCGCSVFLEEDVRLVKCIKHRTLFC